MRFVTLRELMVNASKVLDELGRDDIVVTRNGKPAAALVHLDEESLEDFVLAHHPTLIREVKTAWAEYKSKGGINHDTVRRRLQRRRRHRATDPVRNDSALS